MPPAEQPATDPAKPQTAPEAAGDPTLPDPVKAFRIVRRALQDALTEAALEGSDYQEAVRIIRVLNTFAAEPARQEDVVTTDQPATPDRDKAVQLRLAGATYAECAREAGYDTPSEAARAIHRAVDSAAGQ